MDQAYVIDILNTAFLLIMRIVGPVLIIAISVGLLVSVLQATTQIQEQTLTFAPKLFAIFIFLMLFIPFILTASSDFAREVFIKIADM